MYKPYYKQIARNGFQVLFQTITIPLGITVNTAIIGHFVGTEALAGLGIGTVIVDTLVGLVTFMIISTNAEIGTASGAKDEKRIVSTIVNTIALGFLLGIAITIIIFFLAGPIVNLFVATDNVKFEANSYVNGMMVGIPFLIVDFGLTGILRGLKKYSIPSTAAGCSLFFNISFSLFFVIVLDLGIFGTGLAVGLAMIIESVIKLFFVLKYVRNSKIRVSPSFLEMFAGLAESVPLMIRSISIWITNLLTVYFCGILGTETMASVQIIDGIWIFVIFIVDSIAQSIMTMIAEQIGAKNFDEAKLITRAATRLGHIYSTILFLVLVAIAWVLPYVFTPDRALDWYIISGCIEGAIIVFIMTYAFVLDGALMAAKDFKYLSFSAVCSTLAFLVTGAIASSFVPHNVLGFIIVYATYDILFMGSRTAFNHFRIKSGKWLPKIS
jgi:putative MATE family efflux protein